MKTKDQPKPTGKFFFDMNVFDSDDPESHRRDQPPPPPTYSEEELAAARLLSFEEGQKAGLAAALNSIEKRAAATLEKIAQDIGTLMRAEQQRAGLYEREAVRLGIVLLQKLTPGFIEKFAEDDLKATLGAVLKKQEGQQHITVAVNPDLAPAIQSHLQSLRSQGGLSGDIHVQEDPIITPGACRLAWQDGGAVRDPEALAREILAALEERLADRPTKRHDKSE